jgi:hypothetical protein
VRKEKSREKQEKSPSLRKIKIANTFQPDVGGLAVLND